MFWEIKPSSKLKNITEIRLIIDEFNVKIVLKLKRRLIIIKKKDLTLKIR